MSLRRSERLAAKVKQPTLKLVPSITHVTERDVSRAAGYPWRNDGTYRSDAVVFNRLTPKDAKKVLAVYARDIECRGVNKIIKAGADRLRGLWAVRAYVISPSANNRRRTEYFETEDEARAHVKTLGDDYLGVLFIVQ